MTSLRLCANGIDLISGSKDGSVIYWKIQDPSDPDYFNKLKDIGGVCNEMVLMDKIE
jgi:hypothetical protein